MLMCITAPSLLKNIAQFGRQMSQTSLKINFSPQIIIKTFKRRRAIRADVRKDDEVLAQASRFLGLCADWKYTKFFYPHKTIEPNLDEIFQIYKTVSIFSWFETGFNFFGFSDSGLKTISIFSRCQFRDLKCVLFIMRYARPVSNILYYLFQKYEKSLFYYLQLFYQNILICKFLSNI